MSDAIVYEFHDGVAYDFVVANSKEEAAKAHYDYYERNSDIEGYDFSFRKELSLDDAFIRIEGFYTLFTARQIIEKEKLTIPCFVASSEY